MDCGFCGSTVNEGFNTCAECGAMHLPDQERLASTSLYLKGLGLLFCIAIALLIMNISYGYATFWGSVRLFLFGCALPAFGMYHFGKQNKEAQRTFKWYRKP